MLNLMAHTPSIIIIGGGVSGLTAGIYAQRNGFQTTVLERHTIAGGLLTGWNRRGYHIDGCVHWMTGTNPHKFIYRIWQTIGALGPDIPLHTRDAFMRIDGPAGSHHIYRDLGRMRDEMLAIAPQDRQAILDFIDAIDRFRDMEIFCTPKEQLGIFGLIRYIWRLRRIKKVLHYHRISLDDIRERFTHPLLRQAVDVYLPKQYYALALFYMYGAFADGNADIPVGGSLAMAGRICRRYESLGGTIRTRADVERILIEDGKAVGVRLVGGEELRADYVVAACDAEVTLRRLLPESIHVPYFEQRYADPQKYPIFANYIAYFGCDARPDMEDTIAFACDPVRVGKTEARSLLMKHYGNEPSFAPKGRMVVQVIVNQTADDFAYWKNLYENEPERYKAEKMAAAEAIRRQMAEHYPELQNLETVEVVTPYSFHRYTGAHQGAYMSFIITPSETNPHQWHNGRIDGISHLYLAGQWLQPPGGLPNAAVTGKFAIQRLCRDHRLPFRD